MAGACATQSRAAIHVVEEGSGRLHRDDELHVAPPQSQLETTRQLFDSGRADLAPAHERVDVIQRSQDGARVDFAQSPMSTVLVAMTVPFGASVGSLHVIAVSPARAAPLPSMNVVALAFWIVASLPGGF